MLNERDSLSAVILAYDSYKKKLNQLEKKFLEAKIGLNSIDKEHIINENYYAILNQAKSFLINDNPISSSISMAFEIYNLIDSEGNNILVSENEIAIKSPLHDIKTNLGNNFDNNLYDNSNNANEVINNEDLYLLEEKLDKLKNINKSQEKQIKNQGKLIEKIKK